MVIYDLICVNDHSFEGWFDNIEDFEKQQAEGLLACPLCNSLTVSRKMTAPKLAKKANTKNEVNGATNTQMLSAEGSTEAFGKLQKMLKQVHDYVDNNYEDVGARFTEEAISMHRGEKDQSPIRGTASAKQIKELNDEGVSALPLPERPINKKQIN